jgi:methyl-accepting chemotaxis protein
MIEKSFQIMNRWPLTAKMTLLVGSGISGFTCLVAIGIVGISDLAELARQAIADHALCSSSGTCMTAIEHSSSRYKTWLFVTAMLFVLVLSPLFALVTLSVVKRVRRAEHAASRIAAHDLSTQLKVEGTDELGRLLKSLDNMQANLTGAIGRVREISESVALTGLDIAQGTQELNSRTEQQATALQQTTATLLAVTATVRGNADNAMAVNELAVEASDLAAQGGAVVNQVVDTMGGINLSSRRIAEVLSVIDGIAFQTNILALNAAVEAARAGMQGRGFAVVASEVRALAQRSAEAATEIKSLIAASLEQVEQGSGLVGQAGQTMQRIVHSIQRVSRLVGEISAASDAQSTSLEQVSLAVSAMERMTQQNATLVEQSAAASKNLSQRGTMLRQTVSMFKLGEEAQCS